MTQKGERAALGGAVAGTKPGRGEAAMAVIEQLSPKPGTDGAGNGIAAEEVGKFAEDEVGVDAGLGFEIAGIGLAVDFAFAFVEKECGLDTMGDFFDKGDEGGDIALVERAAGVVLLELSDDGTGIEDGDVERVAGLAQERSPGGSETFRLDTGQAIERGAAAFTDEAGFQVDRDGSVGALEQCLDFPQEGHAGWMRGGGGSWR